MMDTLPHNHTRIAYNDDLLDTSLWQRHDLSLGRLGFGG